MGKFSKAVEQAAKNAERLSTALNSLPQGGSFAGPSGGGGGGAGVVPPTVFNTTVVVASPDAGETRSVSGGSGGGSGSGGSFVGGPSQVSEEIRRAFAYFQISYADKSLLYQQQILDEYRRITRGGNIALLMRTGAGG